MNRKKRKNATSQLAVAAKPGAMATPASATVPPEREQAPHTRWWHHFLIVLALLALNLALYQRTFRAGFLSVDDGDYVQNNPYIGSLNSSNLGFILTKPYFANYAPATLLSYALDVALAGARSPFAFHISNVLWHGFAVCMVYLLAYTIYPQILSAAAVALVFLVHPAHVEAVAWISSRKDLVATGFGALAMVAYLRYRSGFLGADVAATTPQPWRRRERTPPQGVQTALKGPAKACTQGQDRGTRIQSTLWYASSLLAFVVAAAAKQSVLLLPAAMLAWDFLVERRRDWKMVLDKAPFGLAAAYFGWMTWQAQPGTGQTLRPFVLAATQFADLWLLTGFGKYTLYRPAPDPAAWAPAFRILLVAATALVWVAPLFLLRFAPRYTQGARLAALCYWVLISLVPPMLLSFIVPITDRYLFLPSVAFCILVVEAINTLPLPRGSKENQNTASSWSNMPGQTNLTRASRFVLPATACVAVLWATKTSAYIDEWRDPRSVWYGAHLKTRDVQVAHFLGQWYQDNGERVDDFIQSGAALDTTNQLRLAEAVLADPARVAGLRAEWGGGSTSRTNSIFLRDRLWDLAWEQFEAAVSRRGMLSTPNLFMCRGRLLVREGKFARAIPEFDAALRLAQTSRFEQTRSEGVTHALYAIGVAHWDMGDYRAAQQWLLQAQAVQKKSAMPWIADLDYQVERIKALAAGH